MSDAARPEVVEALKDRIDEMQRVIADAINAAVRDLPPLRRRADDVRALVLGAIEVAEYARERAEHEFAKATLAQERNVLACELVGATPVTN